MKLSSFEGKKSLVVGGSGGIGRELSLLLAQNASDLVIHGSNASEKFSSAIRVRQILKLPARARP